jgi:hypothetical protein
MRGRDTGAKTRERSFGDSTGSGIEDKTTAMWLACPYSMTGLVEHFKEQGGKVKPVFKSSLVWKLDRRGDNSQKRENK